jgi:drug/metabolite transporter (DMT)-like permease
VSEIQQGKLKIIAAFIAIYLVWGTTFLAIKYAVETIPPLLMMGLRSLSAGIALYAWGRLRGDEDVKLKEIPKDIVFLVSDRSRPVAYKKNIDKPAAKPK